MELNREISHSELIINEDGTIFHLHLKPEDICDTILLVGDPARVDTIASMFDSINLEVSSREFVTKKGFYKGVEFMVMSTGIGSDNIDIVLNELDALVNIDFTTRIAKKRLRTLNIVRIGTTGAVQEYLKLGDLILSEVTIGIDALSRFYDGYESVCDKEIESIFCSQMNWSEHLPKPYAVHSAPCLVKLFSKITQKGVTITAPGFYAPQGRQLRLNTSINNFIDKLEACNLQGAKITNIEMESSAIVFLSNLLGHNAITLSMVVAQRKEESSNASYHDVMNKQIIQILNELIKN